MLPVPAGRPVEATMGHEISPQVPMPGTDHIYLVSVHRITAHLICSTLTPIGAEGMPDPLIESGDRGRLLQRILDCPVKSDNDKKRVYGQTLPMRNRAEVWYEEIDDRSAGVTDGRRLREEGGQ